MTYFLLASLALVLVITGFNRVYCIHGINQAYLGLYKGLFDEAVVTVDNQGNYLERPKFYVLRVRYLLDGYFKTNLAPYCRSYSYTVLGLQNGTWSPLLPYVDAVDLTFTAKINDLQTRSKRAVFTIERSPYYD